MNKTLVITVVVILLLGAGVWYIATLPKVPESEVVSRNGLHWHPHLAIHVKGEQIEIPTNIGIGAVHNPMHTHDSSGVIHLEFSGVVRPADLQLGKFFQVWNKEMHSLGVDMKMTVNGEESTEYENYVMQDKDEIALRYD